MNATVPIKQNKFNNGEISPLLYGDVEHPKYKHSLRTCKNWFPTPQGALMKRPGTKFVAFVKDQTYAPRLIPFVFSDSQTFVLEFGNLYVRFYQASKYVGADHALHSYFDGYAGGYYELVTPFTTAMLPYLSFAQVGDVISICYGGQASGVAAIAPQDLVHTSGAVWPWSIGATPLAVNMTGRIAGQATILVAAWSNAVTYNQGDRALLNNAEWISIQNGNLNNSPPALALNSTSSQLAGNLYWMPAVDTAHPATTWEYVLTMTFQDVNGVVFESTAGAVTQYTGNVSSDHPLLLQSLTTSLLASDTLLYQTVYRGPVGGAHGRVGILVISATGKFVDDGRTPDYTHVPPAATNPFLINGASSYPAIVGYLDQRRLFAALPLIPQFVALSRAGDLYNFDSRNVPGSDTDAMTLLFASDVLEQPRSFTALRRGLMLTGQGEWAIGGQGGSPISRANVDLRKQSSWGSSWVRPIKIGNGLVFNTAKNNMVRDLYPLYGTYTDIWDGQDLTVMARHLFDNHTIRNWAFQSVPYPIVWAVRDDGTLLSMTYQHAPPSFGQQLTDGTVAWATHSTGGLGGLDDFEEICCVPEPPEDAVYVVTNRAFGGRAIERMQSPIVPTQVHTDTIGALPLVDGYPQVTISDDIKRAVRLDAAVTWDGKNATATQMQFQWISGTQFTITAIGAVGSWWPVPGSAGNAFSAAVDAGNNCVVLDPDGLNWKFDIVGVTSATQVTAELRGPLLPYDPLNNPASVWFGAAPFNITTTQWGAGINSVPFQPYTGIVPIDSLTPTGSRGLMALVDGEVSSASFNVNRAVIPMPACFIVAGFAYNSDAALLDAYHPSAEIRNKFRNIVRIGFEVSGTKDLWFGKDYDNLVQWQQRMVADAYGIVSPATGYYEDLVIGDWNKNGRCVFRHFSPFPAALASALREVRLGDS